MEMKTMVAEGACAHAEDTDCNAAATIMAVAKLLDTDSVSVLEEQHFRIYSMPNHTLKHNVAQFWPGEERVNQELLEAVAARRWGDAQGLSRSIDLTLYSGGDDQDDR